MTRANVNNYREEKLIAVVQPAVPRRDNTMATVLTAIVFVFILCHAPKAALNIYEVGTVRALVKICCKT